MQEGQHDLQQLGLLKHDGRISERGRLIGGLGVHPRLGMLLVEAHEQGVPSWAVIWRPSSANGIPSIAARSAAISKLDSTASSAIHP